MRVIETAEMDLDSLSPDEKFWIYNGLDSAMPHEILDKLKKQLTPESERIYRFERAQQSVALAMMERGVRINPKELSELLDELDAMRQRLLTHINNLADIIWNKPLNPASPKQLKEIFYDALRIPPIYILVKGERKISTGREAMEKLEAYYYAQPLVKAILAIRDIDKKIQVFRKTKRKGNEVVTEEYKILDGRFRASFHPASTETGRWSSSASVFGTGASLHNIKDEIRRVFIPDPNMVFCYADLEQAESYAVAYISGDRDYLAAIHSGDLHTYVARKIWPNLPWTGDIGEDKKIAERPYYRHFSYRDLAKRGGHALNYKASAFTIAKHLRITRADAESFEQAYYGQFSGIVNWHRRVSQQIQASGQITTMFGRVIMFFDRRRDDATIREAIAANPQSTVAEVLNLGAYRIWRDLDQNGLFELLVQLHDAVLFQFHEDCYDLARSAIDLMKIDVPVGNETMTIPVEAKFGYSWQKKDMMADFHKLLSTPRPSADIMDAIIA